MSVAVRIPARVRRWIVREAQYLVERSPRAAERFRAALGDAVRLLSEQPHAGRPGIIPGSRTLAKGDYLISYRLDFERDGVTVRAAEIFAVRHGRQKDAREPGG